MRVYYPITDQQLLEAFARAVLSPDEHYYVFLPRLTLDKDLPPLRFPVGTLLEDAWRLTVKNVIARIRAGCVSEIHRYRPLDPSAPSSADTIH